MTPLNLAIIFGPNLIWSTSEADSLTSLGEIMFVTAGNVPVIMLTDAIYLVKIS